MDAEHLQREQYFHDDWAESLDPAEVDYRAAFEAPTALENRFIIERLGDIRGKRVLDIGCGLGESSVYFASRGALVTATDISPGMVAFTQRLAALHGYSLEGFAAPAESLIGREPFDVVYCANTIHHLTDVVAFMDGVCRLLKPEGVFCSWDPLRYNPVINVYRRIAKEVRSADEEPLSRSRVTEIEGYFRTSEKRFFWLLSLSLFLKYFLLDRISPNRERYWKRIFQESPASLRWWRPLAWLDHGITLTPALRWLCWNVAIIGRGPRKPVCRG